MADSENTDMDILDAFGRLATPGEPLTTDKIADAIDCDRPVTSETLESLVDRGALETKTVGESTRVWWRPSNPGGYLDESSKNEVGASELYRLTLANLSDTVLLTDIEGEFVYVCPNVHSIFGYGADEVAEKGTVDALLGPNLFDADDLDRQGEISNIERTVTDKHGTEHHLLITVKSVSLGEAEVLYACRDVTERKEREEELREARSQNDRLERFANMLAHELRNPLEIAQTYLQFAESGDRTAFEEVERAHDRIEKTMDLLLVLAKGRKAISDTEAVDVGGTATEVWATIDAESSTLVTESPPTIRARPTHLHHLLSNLMKNAIEHSQGGVTVRVGGLETGFYVADDGPGIPEDERDKVFDAGYTTSTNGIGLGLSFVAQLAEAYGWSYSISESADGGARFEFTDGDVVSEEWTP